MGEQEWADPAADTGQGWDGQEYAAAARAGAPEGHAARMVDHVGDAVADGAAGLYHTVASGIDGFLGDDFGSAMNAAYADGDFARMDFDLELADMENDLAGDGSQ